jgi:hypothetical protein
MDQMDMYLRKYLRSGILNNILKQEYIILVAHVVGYILCASKYGLGGLDIHEQNISIKSIIHYLTWLFNLKTPSSIIDIEKS